MSLPKREAPPGSLLATGHLEVHHLDDDHHNNEASNLLTLCPLCHTVFHVGFHGHKRSVQIIYCPWIRQEDLNLLVHCAAVAISRKGKLSDPAQALMTSLHSLHNIAVEALGEAAEDPSALGAALGEIHRRNPALFAQRSVALANFRILPNPEAFSDSIRYWSKVRWLPEGDWEDAWRMIFESWTAESGGAS